MERPAASYWKEKLQLTAHVEGGAYRELYRSPIRISRNALPEQFPGDRNISTSIYFLLEQGQFSAFHRIASDECRHFHFGDTLLIHEIGAEGRLTTHRLGSSVENGDQFQVMIPAGSWFASAPAADSEYTLVGCTVSPGFDFADFELADREELARQYPQHRDLIRTLTR